MIVRMLFRDAPSNELELDAMRCKIEKEFGVTTEIEDTYPDDTEERNDEK